MCFICDTILQPVGMPYIDRIHAVNLLSSLKYISGKVVIHTETLTRLTEFYFVPCFFTNQHKKPADNMVDLCNGYSESFLIVGKIQMKSHVCVFAYPSV